MARKDNRIYVSSIEADYLVELISKDSIGIQAVRAMLLKKLLAITDSADDGFAELIREGKKLTSPATKELSGDELRGEQLMAATMSGQLVSDEDREWYKNTFGWDL